ncbi:MAG: hypothetical protein M1819_005716 [Sarea resinae]|nr:MAG: hypothetical protein M1819_005716 [Sarea resinae]
MGSGASKPSQSSQYVFASETPVRFSQELVDSFQKSPETDSTRAKTLELQIQSRVTAELEKLQARESKLLDDLAASVTPTSSSSDSSDQSSSSSSLFSALKDKDTKSQAPELSREAVQREISTLRQKLASRQKLDELDQGVEKAKEGVVHCLRLHDRRPLDCWKEVEEFRNQVGRLEKAFVEKVVG